MTVQIMRVRNGKGEVVSTSRNLAGIMRHARKYPATLTQHDTLLDVYFSDGAYCSTQFASASVLTDWIRARVKLGRGNFSAPLLDLPKLRVPQ